MSETNPADRTLDIALDDPARRRMLQQLGLGSAGLWLTACLSPSAATATARPTARPAGMIGAGPVQLTAYVGVAPTGAVTIVSPQTEIGQGVFDSLARLIAEELEADWSQVTVLNPYADGAFVSPISKRQKIGGSDSVISYYQPLRQAGATVRDMLIGAAAARWNVPAGECAAIAGRVAHPASNRSLSFGELAEAATRIPVPASITLKADKDFKLIGKRLARKDVPAKVDGSAQFGADIQIPGTLTAVLRRSNTVQGKLKRFAAASVTSKKGVIALVPLDDAVAVVADGYYNAKSAADALEIEFDETAVEKLDSASIREQLARALTDEAGVKPFPFVDRTQKPPKMTPGSKAAVDAALEAAGKRVLEATYEVPYVAHTTMEPQVCMARVDSTSCEIWAPHQAPDTGHKKAAELLGLPMESIRFNLTFGGGGFGRKWELDALLQCLRIAKEIPGKPVRLIWTREQDVKHDFYRAAYRAHYRAALGADGSVSAIHGRIAGQSLLGFKRMGPPDFPDPTVHSGLIPNEYALGERYGDLATLDLPIPVGFWRSVSLSHNGFFAESFIDELAHFAGKDPYQFRRMLLAQQPRMLAVLEQAAQAADWDNKLPAGRGRGIAISAGFGSICAQVAEVEKSGDQVHLRRMTCAYDCGKIIDPSTVDAQIEGGIVYGISGALAGLEIERGSIKQSNFNDYPALRINAMPKIEVHRIVSDQAPGGIGEAGVPAAAPALANAIFAATGQRVRQLPVKLDGLTIPFG
ncbi:MAG: xanthine dehydrogenase family protein molybdopterin-binding subunit [Pseudomonadales bacterium]|nr:xanthine dehydrogenase family protein molybdopterin-binding subunit [Pseudomonadales bacterium]